MTTLLDLRHPVVRNSELFHSGNINLQSLAMATKPSTLLYPVYVKPILFVYLISGEVCVPELILNETRQDETGPHFPNWRYQDKTTFFWSRC